MEYINLPYIEKMISNEPSKPIEPIEIILRNQKYEIECLRLEIEKLQAKKASRLEDSLFSPKLFEHYNKVAEVLAKSNMIPTIYKGKPEDILVAMSMGYQLGFPIEQSLQDIAVIRGRPCLWGDGLLALALNHPDCISIKEEPIYNEKLVIGYICTVHRKGHDLHEKSFTLQDAQRAGLLSQKEGSAWSSYPERMLQMRARSLALRDKFADAFRGLRIAEIEEDDSKIIEGESTTITQSHIKNPLDTLKNMMWTNENSKTCSITAKETMSIDDKIKRIKELLEEKYFDETRKKKAFDYFKIEKIEDLTSDQADYFILHLEKS